MHNRIRSGGTRLTAYETAEALGASHLAELGKVPETPQEALELAIAARERLRPSQGRRPGQPTDASWTLKRLIPFSDATWARLEKCAQGASSEGRRVGPAQVAAEILEHALATRR